MPAMHESASRLYLAMRELKGVEGPSAVGRALGTIPQTVKNWEQEHRGVSAEGALAAQERAGIDAVWLMTGSGSMRYGWPFKMINPSRFMALKPDQRSFVEGQLAAAIAECERPPEPPRTPDQIMSDLRMRDVQRPGTTRKHRSRE